MKNRKTIAKTQKKRALSKRQLNSESELVQLLIQSINKKQNHKLVILREFDCANGIADVIVAKLAKSWKSNTKLGLVNPRWAFALKELPYRKAFSLEAFSILSGTSERRARSALNEFTLAGYCAKLPNKNLWIKNRQPRPIATNIKAIEAKLKDWGRALIQANRYLDFANESFVILDHANIQGALQNIAVFKSLGVGLASISPPNILHLHYHAPRIIPRSNMRRWQANSQIATQLKGIHPHTL